MTVPISRVLSKSQLKTLAEHGEERTAGVGEEMPLSFLFLFLGAAPCTDWLGDVIARDEDGFVLTGPDAGADGLLETSVPGVYAAGDVRAGSIKRCAIAVGEGAAVVRFVHKRLAPAPSASRPLPGALPTSSIRNTLT